MEEALLEFLVFLDQDLPRSLLEVALLEGKNERAPIMDLTDIFLLPDELDEVGVAGSGGVGDFGGVRGSWCC